MKRWIVITCLAALGAAGSTPAAAATVRYDYDRGTDFSKWQYVAWAAPLDSTATMTERRLALAIAAGFAGRGYILVAEPPKADFLISFQAAAWQDARLEESFHGPAFPRTIRVEREPRGALVIRVVDRKSGRLAWRGVVADDLAPDPESADKKTAKAIAKLLEKFPARGGTK
jgi:hypothetical protein